MTTSNSLLKGMCVLAMLGAGLDAANARDVSSKIAPSEAVYCHEKFPLTGEDPESWTPAALSPDDTFIDVEARCNDDPVRLDEAGRLWLVMPGGYF